MRLPSTSKKNSSARILRIALAALLTAASAAESHAQSKGTFEETCKSLIDLELPRGKVVSAEYVPAGREGASPVSEHCKVKGKLNERQGIEAKWYAIGFELRLPKDWNQRFYFQGGGGTDGVLRPALGSVPSGGVSPNALSNGFAVVSTDAGHLNETGPQGSFLFGIDPQARADYGYNHLPTVSAAARELMDRVYKRKPKYSYFVGCSNGGRQAMMATQRYPDLFDGVIAAAPAYRVVEASLDAAAQTKLFASVAPVDPNGRPQLGAAFTGDELTVISKGILKSCDALDGVADGMVHNIRDCKFDPKTVQCDGNSASAAECLPENKVDAIRRIFEGAKNKDGELVYSSWPYDPGLNSPLWTMWKTGPSAAIPPQALNTTLVAGALSHLFIVPPSPTADLYGFVLKADLDDLWLKANKATAPYLESGKRVIDADSPDIDAFTKRGGKIIFYHGMADGIFSPRDTVSYFEHLKQRYGKQAETFSRLYLIPGMGHCSGGPSTDQFDAVTELVNWVEKKQAPDVLIAKASGNSPWRDRARPLCPYPKQAIYSGKGNIEAAQSFECK